MVLMPLTAAAAKTAQDRYASLPSAARTTMAGVSTMPAMDRIANCTPSPTVSAVGGVSFGSYRILVGLAG